MVGIEPIVTGLLDSQNKTHRIGYGILHRARFGGGFHIVKISKTPVDIIHLMILRKCTVIIRRPDHRGRTSPLVIKSVGEIYVVLRGIAAGSGTQITGHENISGSRSNRLRRRIVLRNPHMPTPNHLILGIESCDQCVSFDKLTFLIRRDEERNPTVVECQVLDHMRRASPHKFYPSRRNLFAVSLYGTVESIVGIGIVGDITVSRLPRQIDGPPDSDPQIGGNGLSVGIVTDQRQDSSRFGIGVITCGGRHGHPARLQIGGHRPAFRRIGNVQLHDIHSRKFYRSRSPGLIDHTNITREIEGSHRSVVVAATDEIHRNGQDDSQA